MGKRQRFTADSSASQVASSVFDPLASFIETFRIDELAAKCLHALASEQAARVIESCARRLPRHPNPSAIVMKAIREIGQEIGSRHGRGHVANRKSARSASSSVGAPGVPVAEPPQRKPKNR